MERYLHEKIRYAGGGKIVLCPIVFTNDSKYFICSSGSNVKMFSVTTGEQIRVLKGNSDAIVGIVLNPANSLEFYSFSKSGMMCLWDFNDAVMLGSADVGITIAHFNFNPKNPSNVFLSTFSINQRRPTYEIYSVEMSDMVVKSKKLFCQHQAYSHSNFHVTPDGECLIVLSQSHWYLYEISTGKSIKYKHSKITCLAVHPKQQFVATGNENGEIVLWYIFGDQLHSKSEPVTTLLHWHHQNVEALCFDSSGVYMYSGGRECVLVTWHLESGRKDFLPRLGSSIIGVNLSSDDSLLSLRFEDNVVKIINARSKLLQVQVEGVTNVQGSKSLLPSGLNLEPRHLSLAFTSPQGQLQFYSPTEDRSLMKLQVGRRNQVQYFCSSQIVESVVTHVAFSENGTWLVTVHERKHNLTESCLQFWYWDQNKHSYELSTRHMLYGQENIRALAYHKTYDSCLTVDLNGKFRIWKVRSVREDQLDAPNNASANSLPNNVLKLNLMNFSKAEDFVWYVSAQTHYRQSSFNCAAYSNDGSLFAVTYANLITFWEEKTIRLLKTFVCSSLVEPINFISFINNSSKVVACTVTRLFVWDLLTCKLVWSIWIPVDVVSVDPVEGRFAVYMPAKRCKTIANETKKDETKHLQVQANGENLKYENLDNAQNTEYKVDSLTLMQPENSFNKEFDLLDDKSENLTRKSGALQFETTSRLFNGRLHNNTKNLNKKSNIKNSLIKTISDNSAEGFVAVFLADSPEPVQLWALPSEGIRGLTFLPARNLLSTKSSDNFNSCGLVYLNNQNEFNFLIEAEECRNGSSSLDEEAATKSSSLSHLLLQQNEFLNRLNSTKLIEGPSVFKLMYGSDDVDFQAPIVVESKPENDTCLLPKITTKSKRILKNISLPPAIVKVNESVHQLLQNIFSGMSHALPTPTAYSTQFFDSITFKTASQTPSTVSAVVGPSEKQNVSELNFAIEHGVFNSKEKPQILNTAFDKDYEFLSNVFSSLKENTPNDATSSPILVAKNSVSNSKTLKLSPSNSCGKKIFNNINVIKKSKIRSRSS